MRLVRGEHQNYFYPDFVICLSHYPGDAPLLRLVETKENVKDAARKARRVPKTWGKVLFLTRDQARLRVVNDDEPRRFGRFRRSQPGAGGCGRRSRFEPGPVLSISG